MNLLFACDSVTYFEVVVVVVFRVRGLWETVREFIPRLGFFFFFLVEISSRTLIPLLRPGSVRSGLAS